MSCTAQASARALLPAPIFHSRELLLALVCPISMIAMALMMRRPPEQRPAAQDQTGKSAAAEAPHHAAPARLLRE